MATIEEKDSVVEETQEKKVEDVQQPEEYFVGELESETGATLSHESVILPSFLQHAIKAVLEESYDLDSILNEKNEADKAPRAPILVFFNSRSGGRMGPTLNSLLHKLIGTEQVFDLSKVKPLKVISHVVKVFDELAQKGDSISGDCLQNLRILVAGGDGTAGWILSTVAQVDSRFPLPVGIIPLGTGNDLSRSFGWGPGFTSPTLDSVRQKLLDGAVAKVTNLDGWQIVLTPPGGTDISSLHLPHAMAPFQIEDSSGEPNAFKASFYNYFSIGMDAQIAEGFHTFREKNPGLAMGGSVNKMIYSSFGCTQGWFCTACSPVPQRRSVSGVATIFIKKTAEGNWEELYIPFRMRSVIILNLPSYGGGRDLWGSPSNSRNKEKGWVPPKVNDGLLEIVGLFDGWHAMVAMGGLAKGKHLAQAAAVKFELRGSQSKNAFLQLDGEPWKQPLEDPREATIIEISKIPKPAVLLAAPGAKVLKGNEA